MNDPPAFKDDTDDLICPMLDEVADLLEIARLLTSNRQDPVTALKASRSCGLTRFNPPDLVRFRASNERENSCKNDDREHEVRHWSGEDNQKALPDRAQLERPLTQMLRDGFKVDRLARRGHVADEFHVPAERQPRHFPARTLAIRPADDFAPEADRESLGRNPEEARDQIMAQLMKENERPQQTN